MLLAVRPWGWLYSSRGVGGEAVGLARRGCRGTAMKHSEINRHLGSHELTLSFFQEQGPWENPSATNSFFRKVHAWWVGIEGQRGGGRRERGIVAMPGHGWCTGETHTAWPSHFSLVDSSTEDGIYILAISMIIN